MSDIRGNVSVISHQMPYVTFCLISVGLKMQMLRERDGLHVKVTVDQQEQTRDRQ